MREPTLNYRLWEPTLVDATKGPLWAVRFLLWSLSQSAFVDCTSLPNDYTKFWHVSHLVFSFKHALADRFSCMIISKTVYELFNDALAGRNIHASQIHIQLALSWM